MVELACPRCTRSFPEREDCPHCGLFMVIGDPHPPHIPGLTVGDDASAIWTATVDVASGWKHATCLLPPITKVEGQMLKALNDPELDEDMRAWVECVAYYLNDLKTFVDTRDVAHLNQTWLELGPAFVGVRETFEYLGLSMDGVHDASNWRANLSRMFDTTDTVQAFTDPNE